eukprot:378202-Pelagomonas_calceolata.AAC.2
MTVHGLEWRSAERRISKPRTCFRCNNKAPLCLGGMSPGNHGPGKQLDAKFSAMSSDAQVNPHKIDTGLVSPYQFWNHYWY